ncbi:MAG: hypothetical protein E4G95_09675, partial [Bacteroidia bacterium]
MKKKTLLFILTIIVAGITASAQDDYILLAEMYGTASWDNVDSLGNHRAVLKVESKADAVVADIPWRLREIGPGEKNIVVVDATTGERIMNVFPFINNSSRGKFAFQPLTIPGEYYVYYLTYSKSGSYYPKVTYWPFENSADPLWISKNRLTAKGREDKLEKARLVQFQAINELNSFYPMEIMATAEEVDNLVKASPDKEFIIFTEDRKYPIRSNNFIPYKWIADTRSDLFRGNADKGEYFTFQAAVFASKNRVEGVKVTFNDLVNVESGSLIPGGSFTCFNTEGIDVSGNYFEKQLTVPAGELRPLWFGVEIAEGLSSGSYRGNLTIEADGIDPVSVGLDIQVSGNIVASMGDDEIWRHSRMRWLNSTLGTDNEIVSPFTPLKLNRSTKTIECLGRIVKLGPDGLPEQITSRFSERLTGFSENETEILDSPVTFMVESGDNSAWEVLNFEFTQVTQGTVAWKSLSRNSSFIMECAAAMDFDGNIDYKITLIPTVNSDINDIAL